MNNVNSTTKANFWQTNLADIENSFLPTGTVVTDLPPAKNRLTRVESIQLPLTKWSRIKAKFQRLKRRVFPSGKRTIYPVKITHKLATVPTVNQGHI